MLSVWLIILRNMLTVVISSGGLLKVPNIYISCVLLDLQRLKSVLFTLLVDSFLYLFKTFFFLSNKYLGEVA